MLYEIKVSLELGTQQFLTVAGVRYIYQWIIYMRHCLTKKGIDVLDKYTFKDLSGGQKGTGPEQTLLSLGSKHGQSQLISTLQNIASTLPYS